MVIDIQELSGMQSGNGLNHIVGNISIGFPSNDFLVLIENLCVDT